MSSIFFCVFKCFSKTESLLSPVFLSGTEVLNPMALAISTTCLELLQLTKHFGLGSNPENKSP